MRNDRFQLARGSRRKKANLQQIFFFSQKMRHGRGFINMLCCVLALHNVAAATSSIVSDHHAKGLAPPGKEWGVSRSTFKTLPHAKNQNSIDFDKKKNIRRAEEASNMLRVTGSCAAQPGFVGIYTKLGVTADNTPFYKHENATIYLYFDADCNGYERRTPRKIPSPPLATILFPFPPSFLDPRRGRYCPAISAHRMTHWQYPAASSRCSSSHLLSFLFADMCSIGT